MLSQFSLLSNSILRLLMRSMCNVFVGNRFFSDKIKLKKFSERLHFSTANMKFRCEHTQTLLTYCIHINTSLNICKRDSHLAEGALFLTVKCRKKINGINTSINTSTERHSRVPYYTRPFFPIITARIITSALQ